MAVRIISGVTVAFVHVAAKSDGDLCSTLVRGIGRGWRLGRPGCATSQTVTRQGALL